MAFPAVQPSLRRLLLLAAALKLPPNTVHALQRAYSVRRSQMKAFAQQWRERSGQYLNHIRDRALLRYRHFAATTQDSDLWIASAVLCAVVFLMFIALGPSKRDYGHTSSTTKPTLPTPIIHGVSHTGTHESRSAAAIGPVSDTCQALLQLPYDPNQSAPGIFSPHGLNSFLFLSAHRSHASRFAVIGLSPRASHRSLWSTTSQGAAAAGAAGAAATVAASSCLWLSYSKDGPPKAIKGQLNALFPDPLPLPTSHETPNDYETVLLSCVLEDVTPSDEGGALFVNIHAEDILVYRENPVSVSSSSGGLSGIQKWDSIGDSSSSSSSSQTGHRPLLPPSDPPKCLTVCILPEKHPVSLFHYERHMRYMKHYGADSFILYDVIGWEAPALREIESLRQKLKVDVSIVSLPGLSRLPPSSSTSSAISTDCVYRTRYSSSWLLPLSLSDFPFVHSSSDGDGNSGGDGRQALRQLLDSHGSGSGRQHSWLSLGSFEWSTQLCVRAAGDDGAWITERMLYRTPDETCRPRQLQNGSFVTIQRGSACVGASGRRRLIVNPQRVSLLTEHASVSPSGNGVHLQTSTAHINTYEGLTAPAGTLCDRTINSDSVKRATSDNPRMVLSYARQTYMQEEFRRAREEKR